MPEAPPAAPDRHRDAGPEDRSDHRPDDRPRFGLDDQVASYDVVVVGAGPAGTAAAVRAAELGARVAVAEARRTGGTCVNTGCVPTRVLARTARFLREVRSSAEYGIGVGEPAVDWTRTVAQVRSVIGDVLAAKDDPGRLERLGVDLFLEGPARFVDPHTLELADSGRRLRGDTVILAVGGRSRRLPVPGAELAHVPEQVLDLPDVPARLAVIGAGNTGAQLVTNFSAFGSQVTLLEVAPRILMSADADIARVVRESFEADGVTVRTGIRTVTGLARTDDGAIDLGWVDDDGEHHETFDAVIMSTGWPAAIDGLGLDAAGVETDGPAIPVDAYLRTNVPHVYAAGDANQQAMLVQAAHVEAEAAAKHAVLGATRRSTHHLMPSGGFTDPDYAGVGLTEAQARERDEAVVVVTVPYAAMERPIIDGRDEGFLKLITDRRREVVLGAHAVGESAVEVIQAVTTAMAAGVDVSTLATVEFAYPTYSAIIGEAARELQGTDSRDGADRLDDVGTGA
ncbi:dihydrolipoyl dehydrogenase family protein [Aquipuribacter sp. MA13-6]|uniref:dihydrolipoyl dehydrogenase family protein n=1 Tax=unclassified Aquipuribacter TaxID=2635084 RepID=UPI003EEB5649